MYVYVLECFFELFAMLGNAIMLINVLFHGVFLTWEIIGISVNNSMLKIQNKKYISNCERFFSVITIMLYYITIDIQSNQKRLCTCWQKNGYHCKRPHIYKFIHSLSVQILRIVLW